MGARVLHVAAYRALFDDGPWLSTSGADLLDQLPPGVGVLLDVEDARGLPLLPPGDARPRFSNEVASG